MTIHKYIYEDPTGKPSIFIDHMKASPEKSGTALMREAMIDSFNRCEGRVHLLAMWGSHVFHLKRGFCPTEGSTVKLEEMYGLDTSMAVENFLKRGTFFEHGVKKVIAAEFDFDLKKITTGDLEKYRDLLVYKVHVPAVDSFAYRLANAILQYREDARAFGPTEARLFEYLKNGGQRLKGETMMMTPEGRERWKTAIDTGGEFHSFRDLSHLFQRIKRPYVKKLLIQAMSGMPGFVLPSAKIRVICPLASPLTIRGQGPDLDWTRGKPLEKSEDGSFVYCIVGVTQTVAYKILLDDAQWEAGANHEIEMGQKQEIAPTFSSPIVISFSGDRTLFIRGTGPGMSWDRGIELKRINEKFVFDPPSFEEFEFKVLLDDQQWSLGENYRFQRGKSVEISPKF